jgi:hypothetical protein
MLHSTPPQWSAFAKWVAKSAAVIVSSGSTVFIKAHAKPTPFCVRKGTFLADVFGRISISSRLGRVPCQVQVESKTKCLLMAD